MHLDQPYWLLLLFVLPLLWRRHNPVRPLDISTQPEGGQTWRTRLRPLLPPAFWIAVAILMVAMARPQWRWQEKQLDADGIDIMLALDISPSMLSRDFKPDRLTVAKQVLVEFVDRRPFDRIGLVGFAAEAFTQCPLTTDHRILQRYIADLEVGRLKDGTAIGMGVATALNRLKNSDAKSKVVILVTDGENNSGYISPAQAADLAARLDIRLYTVGIGTEGVVLSPARRNMDGSYWFEPRNMTFDTRLLQEMAETTGGKFYRAFSPEDLLDVYGEIDRLERSKVRVSVLQKKIELAPWLILGAAALLSLAFSLKWGPLRSVNDV